MPLLDFVPRSFGEYEAAGGGGGLQTALAAWPVAVIQEVTRSGLRGRGGAGFPTGDKWRAVRAVGAGSRYAVCNAAEGEPATFKDRLLVRTNPYQVLEGLAIAAYAVGAEVAYINPGQRSGRVILELHGFQDPKVGDRMHIEIHRTESVPWFEYWAGRFEAIWDAAREPGADGRVALNRVPADRTDNPEARPQ